jgi:hypothetical protein
MSTFSAVDSASDALLAITALLVTWQDKHDTQSSARVCSALNDTLALLRCTSASTGSQCATLADVSSASTVSLDRQQLARYYSSTTAGTTMQGTIALLLPAPRATSSSGCRSGLVVDGPQLKALAAITPAAVQEITKAASLTETHSKVSSADALQATLDSSAGTAATSHTRSVSTQTDESGLRYDQLQQQLNTLTARLEQCKDKCNASNTAAPITHQQTPERHASSGSTSLMAANQAAAAALVQVYEADASSKDKRLQYGRETACKRLYTGRIKAARCTPLL